MTQIKVTNLQMLQDFPFDNYLALPGYSYSGIKSNGVAFKAPTAKMQLGTMVHNYLLEPAKYNHDHPQARLIKRLAIAIKERLGTLWPYLLPELAITADFLFNGFKLPYKGRLDCSIPNVLVLDLKVSEMPLLKAVSYFGYDNQLSGYAIGINAPAAIILSVNPKTEAITQYNVIVNDAWWRYQICQKGEPVYG